MSSSEFSIQRLTLVDFETELPPEPTEDFTEQSEFDNVVMGFQAEPTAEEAYRRGLGEGEQRGYARAMELLQPSLDEFRQAAEAMTDIRQQRLADAESELGRIASEVARRILHGELQQAEDVVLRMARACIEESTEEGPKRLLVSEDDLELVRSHLPELEQDLMGQSIQVVADPGLTAGNVVLLTPVRCYDGRPGRILATAKLDEETES